LNKNLFFFSTRNFLVGGRFGPGQVHVLTLEWFSRTFSSRESAKIQDPSLKREVFRENSFLSFPPLGFFPEKKKLRIQKEFPEKNFLKRNFSPGILSRPRASFFPERTSKAKTKERGFLRKSPLLEEGPGSQLIPQNQKFQRTTRGSGREPARNQSDPHERKSLAKRKKRFSFEKFLLRKIFSP